MERMDYNIRAYVFVGDTGEVVGNFLNDLIDAGEVRLVNTVIGKGQLVCFYDLICRKSHIRAIDDLGGVYLPMNHYGEFLITCPEGDRIDDDMILKDYSDNTLNGFNIKCKHGYRTARVRILP